MRRPHGAKGGVREHRADRVRIDSGAPLAGHRGGLERQPCNCTDDRNNAGDQREATYDRRERKPEPLWRIGPKISAHAEYQHRRQEMGEPAERERGHGRLPQRRRATRLRTIAVSRVGAHEVRHIFMPFMAPPVAPVPDAPIPMTLNSTSTGPACSKLSVALMLSPLVNGWVR